MDPINITADINMLSGLEITDDEYIRVRGELRSFNNKSGKGSKLVISVLPGR